MHMCMGEVNMERDEVMQDILCMLPSMGRNAENASMLDALSTDDLEDTRRDILDMLEDDRRMLSGHRPARLPTSVNSVRKTRR